MGIACVFRNVLEENVVRICAAVFVALVSRTTHVRMDSAFEEVVVVGGPGGPGPFPTRVCFVKIGPGPANRPNDGL